MKICSSSDIMKGTFSIWGYFWPSQEDGLDPSSSAQVLAAAHLSGVWGSGAWAGRVPSTEIVNGRNVVPETYTIFPSPPSQSFHQLSREGPERELEFQHGQAGTQSHPHGPLFLTASAATAHSGLGSTDDIKLNYFQVEPAKCYGWNLYIPPKFKHWNPNP